MARFRQGASALLAVTVAVVGLAVASASHAAAGEASGLVAAVTADPDVHECPPDCMAIPNGPTAG